MLRLDTRKPGFAEAFERLVNDRRESDDDVARDVARIIEDVRSRGDNALADYTARWDDHNLGEGADWRISPEECREALQWVDASGRAFAGHRAVGKALLASRSWVRPAGAVLLAPGVALVAAPLYRWVSRNRYRLPGGSPACAVTPPPAA